MYQSFVAILYPTLALIFYSTLVQALPANGEHRVIARETDISYYGTMIYPTATALAAAASATTTSSSGKPLPMAVTLGIIVGGTVFVFLLIGGLTWYFRRRNSSKRDTLVLKVDEPTNAEIAQVAMTRKATTSTQSSSDSGRGPTSAGTLHTINVVSPMATRSPPAAANPDGRRSMNLPSNPRQPTYIANGPARNQYTPGFQPPAVPAVPTIVATSPTEEGRSFISRPITLLPPVPQVLPAGRPQMAQMNQPGGPRHYMLQSGTIGRQPQPGNQPRNVPNRRETLREDTVSSAFGLNGSSVILSESPQSMIGVPLRQTETTLPSGRR